MRLGYERIVKDKRIMISVEESDNPLVTLKVQGYDGISFNASYNDSAQLLTLSEMQEELKEIVDAVHQAFLLSNYSNF